MNQSDLKLLVRKGAAKDITNEGDLPKGYRTITTTAGVYGMNGALFMSKTGKFYVIIGRVSKLFKYC